MKNLLITALLCILPFSSPAQSTKLNAEVGLQYNVEKSVEARAYATMTVCDIVKGEWGVGFVSNKETIKPVLFIRNKFRVVTQDGFSVYIIPFWFYGYLTENLRDIYNSVEIDYEKNGWMFTIGMNYKWTKVVENFNNDVWINLSIKKKLFR